MCLLEQAKKGIEEEIFRKKVEAVKVNLRKKRYLFPWGIKIINLNKEIENECK